MVRRPLVRTATRLTALALAVGLGALGVTAPGGAPRAAADPSPPAPVLVRADEQGCREIAYVRGGVESLVRPLVPADYGLSPVLGNGVPLPGRVRVLVNELSCDDVTVDGHPTGSAGRSTTTLIFSALVSSYRGTPTSGAYVLHHATDNPVLWQALHRAGWPVELLSPGSAMSVATDTAASTWTLSIADGGTWDHTATARVSDAVTQHTNSVASYLHDIGGVQQRLCYANDADYHPATLTADLTSTPLGTLLFITPNFTNLPVSGITGGWSSVLTTGACPGAAPPQT